MTWVSTVRGLTCGPGSANGDPRAGGIGGSNRGDGWPDPSPDYRNEGLPCHRAAVRRVSVSSFAQSGRRRRAQSCIGRSSFCL